MDFLCFISEFDTEAPNRRLSRCRILRLPVNIMITFTSFPVSSNELSTGHSTDRYHVQADISMDEDFEARESKMTYPGESLTSAQSFMRYVSCIKSKTFH